MLPCAARAPCQPMLQWGPSPWRAQAMPCPSQQAATWPWQPLGPSSPSAPQLALLQPLAPVAGMPPSLQAAGLLALATLPWLQLPQCPWLAPWASPWPPLALPPWWLGTTCCSLAAAQGARQCPSLPQPPCSPCRAPASMPAPQTRAWLPPPWPCQPCRTPPWSPAPPPRSLPPLTCPCTLAPTCWPLALRCPWRPGWGGQPWLALLACPCTRLAGT